MLELKRGDTLSVGGFLPVGALPAGIWVPIAGVYDKKLGTKFPIAATLTPPSGGELRYFLQLYAPFASTQLWPVGKLPGDVQFTDASASPEPFRKSTKTFIINVVEDYA